MDRQAVNHMIMTTGWSVIVALAITAPASAHHSSIGYDLSKTNTAEATIKEFRWTAPHSAVVFVIKDKDGKQQELNVTTASPAMLVRQGFKVKDFKVGSKVAITWHPSKSGALGGTLATIKLPDGRLFTDTQFATGSLAQTDGVNQANSAQTQ